MPSLNPADAWALGFTAALRILRAAEAIERRTRRIADEDAARRTRAAMAASGGQVREIHSTADLEQFFPGVRAGGGGGKKA